MILWCFTVYSRYYNISIMMSIHLDVLTFQGGPVNMPLEVGIESVQS